MADVKISALPAATTPLDGTEVLPIVQSSTTKQVAVSNLTAGRAMSATSLTLTTPLGVASGGTGLTSLTAGYIPYGNGTGAFGSSANLFWDSANGRLGIGTATPSYVLDVQAVAAQLNIKSTTSTNDVSFQINNGGGNLWLGRENSVGSYFGVSAYSSVLWSNGAYPMVFATNGTEKLRIASDGSVGIGYTTTSGIGANGLGVLGNVGIGTSNPVRKLHVVSGSGDTTPMRMQAPTSSGYLDLVSSGTSAYAVRVGVTGNNLELWSGGNTTLTLDANSNLGLGVTPSAWSFGGVLQSGRGAFFGDNGGTSYLFNAYYSAGYKYIATGATASRYEQSSGTHQWYIAPSGSAGSAISFTQAMTLDASGQLQVGSTNARSSRLSIEQTGTSTKLATFSNAVDSDFEIKSTASGVMTIGPGTGALSIQSAGSAAIRIDASGNLLVGTTSSAISGTKLQVRSTDTSNPTAFFNVDAASSTAAPGINVRKYDNNITTAQTFVTFAYNQGTNGAGGIQGNGTNGPQFYNSSDERLKENIVDLSDQLARIVALKPRVFDLIDGAKNNTGFIAQEMQSVYPEFVGEDDKGFLTIGGVGKIDAYIIKAIQELAAKVSALEAKQ